MDLVRLGFLAVGLLFLTWGTLIVTNGKFYRWWRDAFWKEPHDGHLSKGSLIYNRYMEGGGDAVIGAWIVYLALFFFTNMEALRSTWLTTRTSFRAFFFSIVFVAILSATDSRIIQQQVHGEVNLLRAVFQIGLALLILFLLWGGSTPAYILAMCYAIANACLYGYELVQYFLLGNAATKLPVIATVFSVMLILGTCAALFLFARHYLNYRA